MKKILAVPFLLLAACSLDDVINGGSSPSGLSTDDMVSGLKTALINGIMNGSTQARGDSVQLDGYLTQQVEGQALAIILPPDVQTAFNKADTIDASLRNATGIGLDNLTTPILGQTAALKSLKDSLYRSINHAASYAAPRSVAIFDTAITNMTITDAQTILFSSDSTSATTYLKTQTYSPLQVLFQPIINTALSKVQAQQLWQTVTSQFNSLSSNYNSFAANGLVQTAVSTNLISLPYQHVDTLQTDMSGYVTTKGLDGLFLVVGGQEKLIRHDPVAYAAQIGKDLLEKVFGTKN